MYELRISYSLAEQAQTEAAKLKSILPECIVSVWYAVNMVKLQNVREKDIPAVKELIRSDWVVKVEVIFTD